MGTPNIVKEFWNAMKKKEVTLITDGNCPWLGGRMGNIYSNPQTGTTYAQLEVCGDINGCLLYTSPSPRDRQKSRMPSSA